jgi:hypothetical protein
VLTTCELQFFVNNRYLPVVSLPYLQRLNHEASQFHHLSVQVATVAEHLKCKGRVHDPAEAYIRPILSCSAFVAGAAMVFAFMPRLANFKAPRLN